MPIERPSNALGSAFRWSSASSSPALSVFLWIATDFYNGPALAGVRAAWNPPKPMTRGLRQLLLG